MPAPVLSYTAPMLWVKSFHIVLVASWFAGLFYLPRIFVNLAMVPADSVAERARLILMAEKLYRFTVGLGVVALVLGVWLWALLRGVPGFGLGAGSGWLHLKLVLVLAVLAYQWVCGRLLQQLRAGQSARSHVWFRWFNELPVLLLLAIVVLTVVKPF